MADKAKDKKQDKSEKTDFWSEINKKQEELNNLFLDLKMGKLKDLSVLKKIRKEIARLKTEQRLNEILKENKK